MKIFSGSGGQIPHILDKVWCPTSHFGCFMLQRNFGKQWTRQRRGKIVYVAFSQSGSVCSQSR